MNTSLDAAFPELLEKVTVMEGSSSPAALALRDAQEDLENHAYQATPAFWEHVNRANSLATDPVAVSALQEFAHEHNS